MLHVPSFTRFQSDYRIKKPRGFVFARLNDGSKTNSLLSRWAVHPNSKHPAAV
jgi:hypothetical protein